MNNQTNIVALSYEQKKERQKKNKIKNQGIGLDCKFACFTLCNVIDAQFKKISMKLKETFQCETPCMSKKGKIKKGVK